MRSARRRVVSIDEYEGFAHYAELQKAPRPIYRKTAWDKTFDRLLGPFLLTITAVGLYYCVLKPYLENR